MRIATKNPKCRQCKVVLNSSNYKSWRLTRKDYLCNDCANKASRIYQKQWRDNNHDKALAKDRRYREKNPDKRREWDRAKVCRKYGLTTDDYDKMYNEQHGYCALCGKHSLELSRKLDIDHNHVTNKNRGLLCSRCNIGIGYFKVDEMGIDLLQDAIEYIKSYI